MTEPGDFSSDTSDDDYIPEEQSDDDLAPNGEEDLESELGTENGQKSKSKSLKRKQLNGSEQRKRKGGIKLATENTEEDSEKEEENATGSDNETVKDEEPNKKRADDLWSSFMKDVEMKPKPKSVDTESRNVITKDKKAEKQVITRVYEFAGEEVRVTEEVSPCSKSCNERISQPGEAISSPSIGGVPKKGGGGISNILSKISGKKKINTLEKSRLDWNQFKQAEGIEEEICTFNKGKEGYLEKQAFLERSDLRQFEIERNLRMMTNRSNR